MSYLTWCQNCQLRQKCNVSTEEDRIKIQSICSICLLCNYNSSKGGCHSIVISKG